MSRDVMRGLKSKIEEEQRIERVNQIVKDIYGQAVRMAMTKVDTSFNFEVPKVWGAVPAGGGLRPEKVADPVFKKNMPDILAALRIMFPDCSVSHTLLCTGNDGKTYDISKLDDTILPFVNRALESSFIVIDWS